MVKRPTESDQKGPGELSKHFLTVFVLNFENQLSLVMRKSFFFFCFFFFAYAKSKTQFSFAVVTAKLISAFVCATRLVQSLYFLNPEFQASSHLLWLYSPVCVRTGRKPRRPVFQQRGSIARHWRCGRQTPRHEKPCFKTLEMEQVFVTTDPLDRGIAGMLTFLFAKPDCLPSTMGTLL